MFGTVVFGLFVDEKAREECSLGVLCVCVCTMYMCTYVRVWTVCNLSCNMYYAVVSALPSKVALRWAVDS